jgi:hypothetical protein
MLPGWSTNAILFLLLPQGKVETTKNLPRKKGVKRQFGSCVCFPLFTTLEKTSKTKQDVQNAMNKVGREHTRAFGQNQARRKRKNRWAGSRATQKITTPQECQLTGVNAGNKKYFQNLEMPKQG